VYCYRKVVQKTVVTVKIGANVGKLKNEGPPSDFWSWRKYGQKPIKGSPYPRFTHTLLMSCFLFLHEPTFFFLRAELASLVLDTLIFFFFFIESNTERTYLLHFSLHFLSYYSSSTILKISFTCNYFLQGLLQMQHIKGLFSQKTGREMQNRCFNAHHHLHLQP
jgi:hypothetical protein